MLLIFPFLGFWPGQLLGEAREHQAWLWLYGTNLLQAWEGGWPFGRFNHFWSLAVEEHFYLLWPLVISRVSRIRAMQICGALVGFSVIARIAWLACGGNDTAAEVFTLFRLDSLAAGAWIALSIRGTGGPDSVTRWAKRGVWFLGAALVLLALCNRRMLTAFDPLYLGFFSCLILLGINVERSTWLGSLFHSRVLRFFGKYSYGMYVFQNLLIPLLAPLLTPEGLAVGLQSPLAGRICYLAMMSTATTAMAVASYHLFENQFLQLSRYFVSNPEVLLIERAAHPLTSQGCHESQ